MTPCRTKIEPIAPPASRAGFTLLELLVALAMVAALAASLYTSLSAGLRAQRQAERSIEPVRTAALAFEALRADLEAAVPPAGIFSGSFVASQGQDDRGHEADSLVFHTTADGPEHAVGNGEIKRVEYALVTADDGTHALVRRVTRNLLAQPALDPDQEVVCRGAWSFTVRSFDGGTTPIEMWDSTQRDNTLPLALEAVIELKPDESPDSPEKPTANRRVFTIPCSTLVPGSSSFDGMGGGL